MDTDLIAKVCRVTGVNAHWLVLGEGPMRGGVEGPAEGRREAAGECLSLEEYCLIPMLESRVVGGPDGEILYENVADHLPFKRWWVQKLVGRSADRQEALVLTRVRGDSMMPTISQGEVVLVDTHESERLQIRTNHIYLVMRPGGEASIKRLVYIPDPQGPHILCLSDNAAAHPPFTIPIEPSRRLKTYVLGRVRWAGKEFE
jgi:phage repressor protein C with HTH and peptisase S24 domain